jgi:hypothetical protein
MRGTKKGSRTKLIEGRGQKTKIRDTKMDIFRSENPLAGLGISASTTP